MDGFVPLILLDRDIENHIRYVNLSTSSWTLIKINKGNCYFGNGNVCGALISWLGAMKKFPHCTFDCLKLLTNTPKEHCQDSNVRAQDGV